MSEDNRETGTPEQRGTKMVDVGDLQNEVNTIRAEAAKWRVAAKEQETLNKEQATHIKTLTPLAKQYNTIKEGEMSEIEKLNSKIADMETAVELANGIARTAQIKVLAIAAGVSEDKIPFLDTSSIDVNDKESSSKVFEMFADKTTTASTMVNPSKGKAGLTLDSFRAMSADERQEELRTNPQGVAGLTSRS